MTPHQRRDVIDRAQMEAGLLTQMVNVPIPRSRNAVTDRKLKRALRYYRRFYRPQRQEG